MATWEEVIAEAGGCGRFQLRQLTAINSIRVLAFWGIIFMSFGNYSPGWRCRVNLHTSKVTSNLTLRHNNDNLTTNIVLSTDTLDMHQKRVSNSGSASVSNSSSSCCRGDGNDNESDYKDLNRNDLRSKPKCNNNSDLDTNDDSASKSCLPSYIEIVQAYNASYYSKDCRIFEICPSGELEFDPIAVTIVTEWGLVCRRAKIVPFIISIQMVGFFFGCMASGQVSELFGRRVAIYGSLAIYGVFSLIAIFSNSWQMFTAFLFFIGFGAGGVVTVALVYSFEFLESRWRAILGGLPLLNVSSALFALFVYLTGSWFYMNLAMAAFSSVCFLTIFWTPESMRWLSVHGKKAKSIAVVHKMAAVNNKPQVNEAAFAELFNITTSTMTRKTNTSTSKATPFHEETSGSREGNQQTSNITPKQKLSLTYVDIFRESKLRWKLIKLGIIWTSLVAAYFVISFSVKSFKGNFYINLFIYSIIEIPVVIVVGPLANRLGRKFCGLTFFLLGFMACLVIVIMDICKHSSTTTSDLKDHLEEGRKIKGESGNGFFDQSTYSIVILILGASTKAILAGARNLTSLFTVELFPTVVRNLCYAFCMLVSRVGVIAAPFLVPEDDTFTMSFSVMTALCFLSGILMWTLPETNDRAMPEYIKGAGTTPLCKSIQFDDNGREKEEIDSV